MISVLLMNSFGCDISIATLRILWLYRLIGLPVTGNGSNGRTIYRERTSKSANGRNERRKRKEAIVPVESLAVTIPSRSTTEISISSLLFHSVPELRRNLDLIIMSLSRKLEDFAPSQFSNFLNVGIAIV